jgi:hypothetical protein
VITFNEHLRLMALDLASIRYSIGTQLLPSFVRLAIALEMYERWHRSRTALGRAVVIAVLLFVMLVVGG